MSSAKQWQAMGDTYWNEERLCGVVHSLAEGSWEQDETSEDESREEDKEKHIQYENDGPNCHQATKCMRCDGE